MTNKTTEPAALAGIEPVAWITGGDCYADGHIDCYAWITGEFTTPLYSAATVEQLVQERDEIRHQLTAMQTAQHQAITLAAFNKHEAEKWHEATAASQAREQQLRVALDKVMAALKHLGDIRDGKTLFEQSPTYDIETYEAWMQLNLAVNGSGDALALPQDDTALRQWGAKLLRDAADVLAEHPGHIPSNNWSASSALGSCEERIRRKADELEGKK